MSKTTEPSMGPLPALIFSSRWLQLPLYLGLIVAQGVYVFLFLKELWHLIHEAPVLTEQSIMLIIIKHVHYDLTASNNDATIEQDAAA